MDEVRDWEGKKGVTDFFYLPRLFHKPQLQPDKVVKLLEAGDLGLGQVMVFFSGTLYKVLPFPESTIYAMGNGLLAKTWQCLLVLT